VCLRIRTVTIPPALLVSACDVFLANTLRLNKQSQHRKFLLTTTTKTEKTMVFQTGAVSLSFSVTDLHSGFQFSFFEKIFSNYTDGMLLETHSVPNKNSSQNSCYCDSCRRKTMSNSSFMKII
jgi:hypothetical protein